jgi:predicted DNA-binding ribbon-helix-helix protein
MEPTKKRHPGGRPRGTIYGVRTTIYDNERGTELMRELAQRRGCGIASLVRELVREEARRQGLIDGED